MNPDYVDNCFTLDWDDISRDECRRRIDFIRFHYSSTIRKIQVSLSPLSGYHIRIQTSHLVQVALWRRALKDDGNRLVHDLLNRSSSIHDILWCKKVTSTGTWREVELT